MRFQPNPQLIERARTALGSRNNVYWIVGGAGSGKSTVCRELASRLCLPLYDMDAFIYGAYHPRFDERHPVNREWLRAENGLAWLLGLSWEEFDQFNRAALPEYLDLLAEDLNSGDYPGAVLIDGGICTPALLAQAVPSVHMVCLAAAGASSAVVWQADEERLEMKDFILQLPDGAVLWEKFITFDQRITTTILTESSAAGIPVCTRAAGETVAEFARRVQVALRLPDGADR